MGEFDRALFLWINHWPEFLAPGMVFLSVGIKGMPLRISLSVLVLGMIAMGLNSRRAALQALVAWPIANGITDLLKSNIPRPRPCDPSLALDVVLRTGLLTSNGTASAHSANMAAVATVFTARLGWWGAPWILVAFLTGISRIYVGVHFPSQVVLGWTVGVGAGLLVVWSWNRIVSRTARVKVEQQHDSPASTP